MKKKIIIGIVIVVAIIVAIVANNKSEENPNGKPVVKIGVSLPLTGNFSEHGDRGQYAISKVMEKWDRIDTKYNYKIIIEDNRMESKRIASVANKLINSDNVNAYLSVISQAQAVAKTQTEMNKTINIGCSWGSNAHSGFYNINNMTSNGRLADKMLEGLKKHNVKKVAMFVVPTAGGVDFGDVLIKKLEAENIEVVFKETPSIDMTDYAMPLLQIKAKKPDIIIVILFPKSLGSLVADAKKLSIDIPFTSVESFNQVDNKSVFEDKWFVSYIKPIKSNTMDKEIFNWTCTPNTYDNLDMLIYSFENVNSFGGAVPTNADVIDYIIGMKTWDGIAGELIINKDGLIDSEPFLAIIKNGKVEVLEEK